MLYASFFLIIQIAMIVHVIRTGRSPWWVVGLILFPGISSLLYVASVLIDDGGNAGSPARSWRQPSLAQLRLQWQQTPTADASRQLAEALSGQGQWQEACDLYQQGLTGANRYDTLLLHGLAQAQLALNQPQQALQTLQVMHEQGSGEIPQEAGLTRARVLDALDAPETEQAWRSLIGHYPGPEPACRYADWLLRHRRFDEARAQYRDVLDAAARNGHHYHRLYRPWIRQAKAGIPSQ
ncbi:MAG: tetratricopeptide repeat protein [Pseudomonadales bacterium]|nr:tetratricopeptide repeat protein [Pseudomonadales bacterium]